MRLFHVRKTIYHNYGDFFNYYGKLVTIKRRIKGFSMLYDHQIRLSAQTDNQTAICLDDIMLFSAHHVKGEIN